MEVTGVEINPLRTRDEYYKAVATIYLLAEACIAECGPQPVPGLVCCWLDDWRRVV